jgi:hypothetical protein
MMRDERRKETPIFFCSILLMADFDLIWLDFLLMMASLTLSQLRFQLQLFCGHHEAHYNYQQGSKIFML